jgi:hypothetical protein
MFPAVPPELSDPVTYADLLSQRLGVKVEVDLKDKNQGKLVIDFYSTDDFDKFYERLSNEQ